MVSVDWFGLVQHYERERGREVAFAVKFTPDADWMPSDRLIEEIADGTTQAEAAVVEAMREAGFRAIVVDAMVYVDLDPESDMPPPGKAFRLGRFPVSAVHGL
jgi:hypothetical protein